MPRRHALKMESVFVVSTKFPFSIPKSNSWHGNANPRFTSALALDPSDGIGRDVLKQ